MPDKPDSKKVGTQQLRLLTETHFANPFWHLPFEFWNYITVKLVRATHWRGNKWRSFNPLSRNISTIDHPCPFITQWTQFVWHMLGLWGNLLMSSKSRNITVHILFFENDHPFVRAEHTVEQVETVLNDFNLIFFFFKFSLPLGKILLLPHLLMPKHPK